MIGDLDSYEPGIFTLTQQEWDSQRGCYVESEFIAPKIEPPYNDSAIAALTHICQIWVDARDYDPPTASQVVSAYLDLTCTSKSATIDSLKPETPEEP